MQKILSWKSLALVLLAVMGISWSILQAQPTNATSASYQRMIELGLIDEVKSPADLGLDYLQQRPPELIAGLVDNIRYTADLARSQMTDNLEYAIPLGSNHPFASGQLRNDNGQTLRAVYRQVEVIGSVTPSGQPEAILGRDLVRMFEVEALNNGSYDSASSEDQTIVADASGSFMQARRIAVIDLIVHDRSNNRYYLLPNVRVDSFCREGLNSIHNGTYHRNVTDVRRLGLRG